MPSQLIVKYHPKGLETAVFFEVSIDPKGLQTQRVSEVSSCFQIQIETKGHADHAAGCTVKATGRDVATRVCNEVQAYRGLGEVSCRSLVGLASCVCHMCLL